MFTMPAGGDRRRIASKRLRFSTDDRLIALVRRGDPTAFEILYDRHCRELLSFCRYMLGSRQDAEDAVQATFASAYRALVADERAVVLRPWLFAIARNACLSVLRQRHPSAGADPSPQAHEDPIARAEQREDLRQTLLTILELPERQRAALVLAELHGLSQEEIGALLGVRADQVKSYVYQARSSLISERRARGADCQDIREELATARGAALLKSHLRRHLRTCPDCSAYAEQLSRQRGQLGALLPLAPSLVLKRRVLEAALGKGSGAGAYTGATAGTSIAGGTAELLGGGVKGLLVKVLAGVVCVGVGVGTHSLGGRASGAGVAVSGSHAAKRVPLELTSFVVPADVRSSRRTLVVAVLRQAGDPMHAGMGSSASQPDEGRSQQSQGGSTGSPKGTTSSVGDGTSGASHGKTEESSSAGKEAQSKSKEAPGQSGASHGKSEEAHGKSEESHGKSEEAPGQSGASHGKSEEAPGHGEEPVGKSEEAHGKSEASAAGTAEQEAHGQSERTALRPPPQP
jgi:RNA polymerase sigma factor (sigma-70 family)